MTYLDGVEYMKLLQKDGMNNMSMAEIIGLVISGLSLICNILFLPKINKKIDIETAKNKSQNFVKEALSVEKYNSEKKLYDAFQNELFYLDPLLFPNKMRDYLKNAYDYMDSTNPFDIGSHLLNDYYKFIMKNKSNFTKKIADASQVFYNHLPNRIASSYPTKSHFSEYDGHEKDLNTLNNLREDLYNLIRERLESIDIMKEDTKK